MDVLMPQLGETVTEGTVLKWYKQAGDTVKTDEALFDIETDKVTMEIPAPAAGVITEILIAAGVTAKVGTRLAVINETSGARQASTPAGAPVARQFHESAGGRAAVAAVARPVSAGPEARLSPVVRRLSAEHGLDLSRISGTGKEGRITRADVLAYLSQVSKLVQEKTVHAAPSAPAPAPALAPTAKAKVAAAPEPVQPGNTVPLNTIRNRTAQHMARSWSQVPHVVQLVEVDFGPLDEVRLFHAERWRTEKGFSLTYMPFIARAVSVALTKYPKLNSTFEGSALRLHKRINLGIAVDLKLDGLVVPVVKDVQDKSVAKIAHEISDLAKRTRAGTLRPNDMSEGTYTLSNNGAFGTVFTASIVNFPQVAILSVDAVRKKPVVIESPAGDGIAIRPIGALSQSFDHRAVDGAYSASFLNEVKTVIEIRNWRQELDT